jgi:hypothetical protein
MTERLIMLDVPGVLYSDRSAARLGGLPDSGTLRDVRFFDPIAVGFVRRLFGLTGARVVISAGWGRGTPAAIFQQLDLQVEALAPEAHGGFGAQVAAFLGSRPAPQAFTILSAAGSTFGTDLREQLVEIDPTQGLTVDNFREALSMLGVACPTNLYPDSQPDPAVRARLLQLRNLARMPSPRATETAQTAHA